VSLSGGMESEMRFRGGAGGDGSGGSRVEGSHVVRRELPDVSTLMISAGMRFLKRNKVATGLWVCGMLVVLFGAGHAVTQEQETEFQQIMSKVDFRRMDAVEKEVQKYEHLYYQTKGIFSCDEICSENYNKYKEAQQRFAAIERDIASVQSEAKAKVGIFSEYGVQEVRDLFWAQLQGGKDFARRSSWYDFIFMSIGSMGRDEGLLEFALRFLINMLLNFTFGLIGALIGFYYFLWGVISSYQTDFLVAFAFFMVASIAATSFVASYLIGLYAAAAGSVYTAAKIGGGYIQLADRQRRTAQQEYLRYQQRQQYRR